MLAEIRTQDLPNANHRYNSTSISSAVTDIRHFSLWNARESKANLQFLRVQPTRCNVSQFYLFLWDALHVWDGFSRPSSREPKCIYSARYLSESYCYLLLAAGSRTFWQMRDAVYAVWCSWWWTENRLKNVELLTEINKIQKLYKFLVVLWEFISDARTHEWKIYILIEYRPSPASFLSV